MNRVELLERIANSENSRTAQKGKVTFFLCAGIRRSPASSTGAENSLALREIVARVVSDDSERPIKRSLAGLRDRGLAKSTDRGPKGRWRRIRFGESE